MRQRKHILSRQHNLRDKSALDGLSKAAAAQYRLGLLYQHGEGVVQSTTMASHWYERAAKRGHSLAHLQLRELHSCYPKTQHVQQ